MKKDIYSSCSYYKFSGFDRYYAWDMWIKETGLKPGIDAKEFYKIFDAVEAIDTRKQILPNGWKPTHYDTLRETEVRMTKNDNGVWELVWSDATTGGYPPCNPPEEGRYIDLESKTA